MRSLSTFAIWALACLSFLGAQNANIALVQAATDFEADNTAFLLLLLLLSTLDPLK